MIKLRKAIDALDRAIENRWGQAKQASKGLTSAYRPVAVEKAINNPDDLDGYPADRNFCRLGGSRATLLGHGSQPTST